MNKMLTITIGAGLIISSLFGAAEKLSDFDKKMINVQKEMILKNKNFTIQNISILKKKKISKEWTMYSYDIKLYDNANKKDFRTPMVIFTDGIHQTNSLMNIASGVRYENIEKQRLNNIEKRKDDARRIAFEKSFKLNEKYYNKEHLISGSMSAKNKVIMISDPLCVACISSFPSMYAELKDREDYAFFYYHYPLQRLHPTASIVSKAMAFATASGIDNVEEKIFDANFNKKYNVYKMKDSQKALDVTNLVLGTKYKLSDVIKTDISMGSELASEIKLRGTPSIIFNGSIENSREMLNQALSKK